MSIEENLKLMKTLDDAWNGQDWDLFSKRHAENVVVRWPGQDEPTRGLAHIKMKASKCSESFRQPCCQQSI